MRSHNVSILKTAGYLDSEVEDGITVIPLSIAMAADKNATWRMWKDVIH